VVDVASQTVIKTIPVGIEPFGIAINPTGSRVYVGNIDNAHPTADNTVSVIDTAANIVVATISLGSGAHPLGIAVAPDGTKVYVGAYADNAVAVIDVAKNTIAAATPVGGGPAGVAFTSNGTRAYVANELTNDVSIVDVGTNTVVGTVHVGNNPIAFGNFIQPGPTFAGTLGKSNCVGQSVSALLTQYGGLNAAAAALGFSSVRVLQQAIMEFCEG